MNNELWRDVVGYEGLYIVSSLGRVLNLPKMQGRGCGYRSDDRILRATIGNHGYFVVGLRKNRSTRIVTIHRLVAEAFIPNHDEKPQVNHKDGNKLNNNVDNLEWVTASENGKHSFAELHRIPTWQGKFGKDHHRSKQIRQFDVSGNLVSEYFGSREAAKLTGISQGNISMCCLGQRHSAGGYIWKYKNQRS